MGFTDDVRLEIYVTPEMASELEELISEHLWEQADGLRILLGAGMGAVKAQSIAKSDGQTESETITRLSQQLIRTESRLASTRFQLAEVKELNQRWELSAGSVYSSGATFEKIVLDQRTEIGELKARLAEQQKEIEHLHAAVETGPKKNEASESPGGPKKKGWLKRT